MSDPLPPTRALPMPPPGASAVSNPSGYVPKPYAVGVPCPKCGSTSTGQLYRSASAPCERGCCGAQAERFDRWCRTCRFAWVTHDVIGA